MKVKVLPPADTFGNLNKGDVFLVDGNAFIKTPAVYLDEPGGGQYKCNAVNIEHGYYSCFEQDKSVMSYPDAELILGKET